MEVLIFVGMMFIVFGLLNSNRDLKQEVKELEEMLEKQQQEENPDQSQ